MEQENNNLD